MANVASCILQRRALIASFLALSICLGTGTVFSQTTPTPDAGELLRREQQLERLKEAPQVAPKAKPAPSKKQPTEAGPRVRVKAFRIEGEVKSIPLQLVTDLLQPYVGRSLSFTDLLAIVDEVTSLYSERGFFLARAILPVQDVTDGIVTIRIIEAPLDPKDEIRFKGESMRLDKDFAKSFILSATGRDGALQKDKVERGLLNLNDNPGFKATADAEAGESPGTTRLVLDVTEGPFLRGIATLDNYGSRYTGAWRYTGSLSLNNPSTHGDQIQLSYTGVPSGDYDFFRIGYSIPIGSDGLRAFISHSDLSFGVGKELASLNAKGSANNTILRFRYPLYRTAFRALFVDASHEWRILENESQGSVTSDKRVNSGALSLVLENTDELWGGGFTLANLSHYWGSVDLSRVQSNLNDDRDSGLKTNGQFKKIAYQVIRIQRGSERLSFQAGLSGQFAQKNLDSSEDFSLGGPDGLKGYPLGEASGDEGHKFGFEARYVAQSATAYGDVFLSLFFDRGRITRYQKNQDLTSPVSNNQYYLSSWGLGLNIVSAGKHDLKIGWARAIGENPARTSEGNNSDGKSNKHRFWVYIAKEF